MKTSNSKQGGRKYFEMQLNQLAKLKRIPLEIYRIITKKKLIDNGVIKESTTELSDEQLRTMGEFIEKKYFMPPVE